MTSASSIEKPWSSDAVRQGAAPIGAVDVGDRSARPADHVVVVVAHPRLVARHRAGGLDAAHQAGVGQRAQDVVHGLVGDVGEIVTGGPDDRVRVGVRVRVHGVQHRQPGAGDPQRGAPQQLLEIQVVGHVRSLRADLESVKKDARAAEAARLRR